MEENNKIIINQKDDKIVTFMRADKELGKLISIMGNLSKNWFEALVKSIVGQQLSIKAANAIFDRVKISVGNKIDPNIILSACESELKKTGLSKSKIKYIKNLSEAIISNDIKLFSLDHYSNEDVIRHLTQVNGIGKWTAEMFLIFTLGRMNVLSLGDVGLHRGAKWLYKSKNDNKEDSIECPGHAIKGITVGAVGQDRKLTSYTSFGKVGEGKLNIVAPGNVHIDGRYRNGTSFAAAPFVSGVLGAILGKSGSVEKAIEYIYSSTEDIGFHSHEQGLGYLSLEKLVEVLDNEEIISSSEGQNQSF